MVTPFGNTITGHNPLMAPSVGGPTPSLGPVGGPRRVSEYEKNKLQRVKIVDTPDMPYIAYRSWAVQAIVGMNVKDMRLESTGGRGEGWKPGLNEAICFQDKHHRDITERTLCECGFYGLLRKDKMTSWGSGLTIPGVFLATGDVVIHGNEGLRAQFARILCLVDQVPMDLHKSMILPEWLDQIYPALAEIYQVPIIPYDRLEMYITEFGIEVPYESS